MPVETIKVRKYKVGYHIYYENVSGYEAGDGPEFTMRSAYTPEGLYVGDVQMARFLIVKRGIKPELARPKNNVCSVGFCEENKKWYGWSHRAIAGFEIGDRLFEADWSEATDETPFVQHGPETIENLEQARQAAVNFAAYVS